MAGHFPHEIKTVTDEEDKIIKKYYKDYIRPFVKIGNHGYLYMAGYGDYAADIYNLEVRPDDIWVVSFARSGTTWLQELVWLVNNQMDFDEAAKVPLTKRFAYIEYPTLAPEVRKDQDSNGRATVEDFRTLPALPSPRYVKTHRPLSLLPPKLVETSKVFYVARDPRDVAVSYFFMHKLFRYMGEDVEFKQFWDLFKNDLVINNPIFPHIEEAWQKRHHPNIMFLFYEEMQKDLRGVIDKICLFLGKEFCVEQREKLIQYLSFDKMKKTHVYTSEKADDDQTELKFMRKGKTGNWVNYFTEEMKKEADEFMQKYLRRTDMRFPSVNNQ